MNKQPNELDLSPAQDEIKPLKVLNEESFWKHFQLTPKDIEDMAEFLSETRPHFSHHINPHE
jgi:hypothetical protein